MMNKEPNTFLVQLQGPFSADEKDENYNLLKKIELEKTFQIHDSATGGYKDVTESRFIKKIGIQITPEASFEAQVLMPKSRHEIQIGDNIFTVGGTGILEIDNLRLTKNDILTIHFLQNENELTLVDFILDTNIIDSEGGK